MRKASRGGGVMAAMVFGLAVATAGAADLAPFLVAHRQAATRAEAKQWTQAAKAYGAFAAAHPGHPGAPLASLLRAVILLRELQRPAEARDALLRAAKAPDTLLGRGLRRAARGWLARLQMQEVDAALRKYWVDEIEYPPSLEALVKRKLIDPKRLKDPWGKPLTYTTGRLKIAPDSPRQKYTLRCTAIEGTSRDFRRFLAETKAFGRGFTLRGFVPGPPPGANLLTPKKASVNVSEGSRIGSATVVKIESQAVILADGEKIAVVMR